VAKFGRIDDSVDASFDAWPESTPDLGKKFGELALSFAGLAFPPARVLKILRDQFSPESRFERVLYLLDGLRIGLKRLQSETEKQFADAGDQGAALREQVRSLQSRIEAPKFEEAVAVACEESARAINLEKAGQFASVLVGALVPTEWGDHDVAKMIRDLAQLNDQDIRVLKILAGIYGSYVNTDPVTNEVTVFTHKMSDQLAAILASKINPEDVLSSCARLTGFGLALEESRTPGDMRLAARCFHPTRRGMVVLSYLGRAE
jgi:hypothetical protein